VAGPWPLRGKRREKRHPDEEKKISLTKKEKGSYQKYTSPVKRPGDDWGRGRSKNARGRENKAKEMYYVYSGSAREGGKVDKKVRVVVLSKSAERG